MSLLKKIIYYSNTYEFKGLKNFYAAWLREIELGKSSWSDEPHHLESAILTKHLRSQKGSNNKPVKESTYGEGKKSINNKSASYESKVWFCQPFQRNKCEHKSNYMIVFKGKLTQLSSRSHPRHLVGKKDSTKRHHHRHHHRHHKRQPGEQQFPKQVVTG